MSNVSASQGAVEHEFTPSEIDGLARPTAETLAFVEELLKLRAHVPLAPRDDDRPLPHGVSAVRFIDDTDGMEVACLYDDGDGSRLSMVCVANALDHPERSDCVMLPTGVLGVSPAGALVLTVTWPARSVSA